MILHSAHIKGIKADVVAGEITFSIAVGMTENNLQIANALRAYAGKDGTSLTVEIYPQQLPLFDPSPEENEISVSDLSEDVEDENDEE